jgi:hypothetical protein
VKTETGVTSLTTDRVIVGTWTVASLNQRSTAEGVGETITTCAMSSAVEIHATGLRIGAESKSALNRNNVMIGTMITTIPTMTNLTNNASLKEGITQEESKLFPVT